MKKKPIKILVLSIFITELIFLFNNIFFASHGLKKLLAKQSEIEKLTTEINNLKLLINENQELIKEMENDNFYKIKIAREILQMGYKNETWLVKPK